MKRAVHVLRAQLNLHDKITAPSIYFLASWFVRVKLVVQSSFCLVVSLMCRSFGGMSVVVVSLMYRSFGGMSVVVHNLMRHTCTNIAQGRRIQSHQTVSGYSRVRVCVNKGSRYHDSMTRQTKHMQKSQVAKECDMQPLRHPNKVAHMCIKSRPPFPIFMACPSLIPSSTFLSILGRTASGIYVALQISLRHIQAPSSSFARASPFFDFGSCLALVSANFVGAKDA